MLPSYRGRPMPRRRSEFTVDAESVQGNAGTTVTFRALKVGEMHVYRTTDRTDRDVLKAQILGWVGIIDDDEKPLPSPADQPDIVDELYMHEQQAMVRLLFQGPDGDSAKN